MSGLSLGDVKKWDAGALDDALGQLRRHEQVFIHSGDDFSSVMPVDGWSGPAHDNADSAHQSLVGQLDTMSAGLGAVTKALPQVADVIPAIQAAISGAEEQARKYGYRVEDDGSITDTLTNPGPSDPKPEDRQRALGEIKDSISRAMKTAEEVDSDLAATLNRSATGGYGTGSETTVQGAIADGGQEVDDLSIDSPELGTPEENAKWWSLLTPAQQAALTKDHPEWLGGLDGLPGATRSAANMAQLPKMRDQLESRLSDIRNQLNKGGLDDNTINALNDELGNIQAKLKSLDKIKMVMGQGSRQLLLLDDSGKRMHAAVAVGDVDTATHVAVFTPGFTSTVNGSLQGYDQSMYYLQQKGAYMSTHYGDHGGVATVTWMGYDAPQWSEVTNPDMSVVSDADAKTAAPHLSSFIDGINKAQTASGGPAPDVTALGHSYGSLVTGLALQQTPTGDVNNCVVFGSPGMDIHHISDLHVPQGHTFSEWADKDAVPAVAATHHFGDGPYGLAGDTYLDTGNASGPGGQFLHGTDTHSQYLDNNSTSQYNMASIIADRPDMAVRSAFAQSLPN